MPLVFRNVTRSHPCPICGKPDYCQIGDRAILCMRVESDHPNERSTCGGWYHHFEGNAFVKLRALPKRPKAPTINATAIYRDMANGSDQCVVAALADKLGVTLDALLQLCCAFSPRYQAFGFPMRNESNEIVGIRLRNEAGQKWAVTGSRQGIFIDPLMASCSIQDQTLLICEGPTDTAAALTLGYPAIGKPCCNSGNDYVEAHVKRLRPARVVIVSDVDSMIKEGIGFIEAQKLKKQLGHKTVIWAPQAKDLRQYLKQGGTKALIDSELQYLLRK